MRNLEKSVSFILIIFGINLFCAGCVGTESMDDPEITPLHPSNNQMEGSLKGDRMEDVDFPALSTKLRQLFKIWQEDPEAVNEWAIEKGLETEGDRVKIMLIMLDEYSAEATLDVISGLGGEVTDHYQLWIDAWVPIGSLDVISDLSGLRQAREPIETVPLDQ